ncbi:hypothetical protein D3C75_699100 [compost metagenome]
MTPPASGILDSPVIMEPSAISACSTTASPAAGSTRPRTANTRLSSRTAVTKSPEISVSAARIRFPRLCPANPSPLLKRYLMIWAISGSTSAIAVSTLRISPGGGICSSLRSMPELPPSSATVTIAVISSGFSFKPRSITDNPVPPPMTTIRGRCPCSSATIDPFSLNAGHARNPGG